VPKLPLMRARICVNSHFLLVDGLGKFSRIPPKLIVFHKLFGIFPSSISPRNFRILAPTLFPHLFHSFIRIQNELPLYFMFSFLKTTQYKLASIPHIKLILYKGCPKQKIFLSKYKKCEQFWLKKGQAK
jgi:hypothetical protein